MLTVERLTEIPFFQGIPENLLEPLAKVAEEKVFGQTAVVARQHDEARDLFFLLDGAVRYLVLIDGIQELLVGIDRRFGAVVGWSGFRSPYRYSASVYCEEHSLFVKIPITAFDQFMKSSKHYGLRIMSQILAEAVQRFREARDYLINSADSIRALNLVPSDMSSSSDPTSFPDSYDAATLLERLKDSPFFTNFPEEYLHFLAEHGELKTFAPGDRMFTEGEPSKNLYMLMQGRIRLTFRRRLELAEELTGFSPNNQVLFRVLRESGQVLAWSSLVEPFLHDASATMLESTQVMAWDREMLEQHMVKDLDFGMCLTKSLLWLTGNRLRVTRIRLIAQHYSEEIIAIKGILKQNEDQLPVSSPLHKLPYYLENRLTLSDAFNSLEMMQAGGGELERRVSGWCLEILKDVRTELEVFHHLQAVYDVVSHAPPGLTTEQIRQEACKEFIKLFSKTPYILRGEENLPDTPGNIFIMNHLTNHAMNTLPNNFLITLDTHFLSSMIIYRKYGDDGGVRVVRKSQPDEFGHAQYYDRLNYIYVYSGHVEPPPQEDPKKWRREQRKQFFDTAHAYLKSGKNFIICPEGDSRDTEESPLPFKAGGFLLAASMDPEPWIVPLAIANFDKNIVRTPAVALIHPPFRVSDRVDVNDKAALDAFLKAYHEEYKGYVQEAIELGKQYQRGI